MNFGKRKLLRSSKIYRALNVPWPIAAHWDDVDDVMLDFDDKTRVLTVTPVVANNRSSQKKEK